MKKLGLIIIILLLCGCAKNENNVIDTNKNEQKAEEKVSSYIIVDVRTKEEYDEGHLEGAINIPYDEIDENVDLDKTKTIMVYCKSGGRDKK